MPNFPSQSNFAGGLAIARLELNGRKVFGGGKIVGPYGYGHGIFRARPIDLGVTSVRDARKELSRLDGAVFTGVSVLPHGKKFVDEQPISFTEEPQIDGNEVEVRFRRASSARTLDGEDPAEWYADNADLVWPGYIEP